MRVNIVSLFEAQDGSFVTRQYLNPVSLDQTQTTGCALAAAGT